ncbi:methylcobamide:CoM methyltransferase MtbA [Clostridium sp. MT-14]|uniref:methylcobamide:CoM methyltransferase MtbA n=1 Tax=unclassified Clostridium TaxID=2614128 RepID=UPI00123B5FB6|nr:methylcobamide:CoM methyltransferase MtbA [Clostridium sp. HV4-5-A1G]KAA8672989.1 MtaA/CmuA family methyltransferase [Clostridium sp. HV4-5-A1G]CAB1245034.1 Methylcobamide--CoM methyltransferase [Clostridiaceae bacterium BL-3]
MLTPKERLKLVLKKSKVDRPPCICPGGMMNMAISEIMDLTGYSWPRAHVDEKFMAELAAGIYEYGGFENVGVPFCMTVEAEAMGAEISLGSKINEPRVIEYPINSVSSWKELKNMDMNSGRAKVVLEAIRILREKKLPVPIMANLTGPISVASSLMEPEIFYKEIIRKSEETREFLEFVTDNLIEFGKAQLKAGADLLTISDPSGTGEIMGPRNFRNFTLPYLNKIVDSLKEYTEYGIIVHICGRLRSIYPELNELHSDAISFDSITSVKQICSNVKNKAIMGNMSTFSLENSKPEYIRKMCFNCIESGVDILAPACGIGPKTPLINIKTMVKAAKDFKELYTS